MSSFITTIAVVEQPEKVFAAVRDVRAWWSGAIEGATSDVGDEFTYAVPDIHWCKIRVTEIDAPRRISWLVLDSWLTFTETKNEWNGTTVTFDVSEQDGLTQVRFTHDGLTPDFECYDLCSSAWTGYIAGSLRHLILTGTGQPNSAPAQPPGEPDHPTHAGGLDDDHRPAHTPPWSLPRPDGYPEDRLSAGSPSERRSPGDEVGHTVVGSRRWPPRRGA